MERRVRAGRRPSVLIFCLLSLGLPAPGKAFDLVDVPPDLPTRRPRYVTDGGSLLGPSGPEVHLAIEIPYPELFFRPAGSRFRSQFDCIFVLIRDGRQVGGDLFSERLEVLDRSDARDATFRVRRSFSLAVPPGEYRAQVILRESAAGRQTRVEWDLDVPDYENLPLSLSSIWSEQRSFVAADSAPLPRSGWLLRRRYGPTTGAIAFSGEVYRRGPETEPTRLIWRILGARGEEMQRGEAQLAAGPTGVYRILPEISSLWLGSYVLEIRAVVGSREARRRFPFQVEATAEALEADARQSLELIELIATSEEIREIRDVPAMERKAAWERFWKRRDPTPDTPENEFRDEFFARVRYANENYSVLGPGWKSDRGRTYIRYGPPDQIETYPMNLDAPAYEIWTYLRLARRFIFVDYDGYGRYELYQPGRG